MLDRSLIILLAALAAVFLVSAALIVHGTIYKTRWGINFISSIECPGCHLVRGIFRMPRNLRQFLWGGGTCPHCGLEVDKWQRPISQDR